MCTLLWLQVQLPLFLTIFSLTPYYPSFPLCHPKRQAACLFNAIAEKDDTPRHEYHQDSHESVCSLQQSVFYSKMPPILSAPLFQPRYWEVLIDDFSSILWNAVILLGSTQVALLSSPFLEKFFRVNSLLAQVRSSQPHFPCL